MCLGGSAPKDNSADIARQQEDARQAKILAGKSAIDAAFDGTTTYTPTGKATSYTPGSSYYGADGSLYAPSDTDINGYISNAQKASQQAATKANNNQYGVNTQMAGTGANYTPGGLAEQNNKTTAAATPTRDQAVAALYGNKIASGDLYTGVNSAHSGGFDDAFYNNAQQNYLDYYDPQLQTQYDDAVKNLTYSLARSGNAASSTSTDQFGKLEDNYNIQKQSIANQAIAAKNTLKSNVASQKANLYTLNTSAADPSLAASQAAAAAATVGAQPAYSPLGAVFANAITNGSNAASIANANTNINGGYVYGAANNVNGSGKVI